MRILERLFRWPPKGYPRRLAVRYDGTRQFEGYLKTGDQLFSKARSPLPPLVYHAFVFDLEGKAREIWVQETEPKPTFHRGRNYRAHLDAAGRYCWFDGERVVVRLRDTEDDDEEGGEAGQRPRP